MKKLLHMIGLILAVSGFIVLLSLSFIGTVRPNERFVRDLFGFPIPEPPIWTSYIPLLGGFIGTVFELFSIHGLVTVTIFCTLLGIGGFLICFDENN